MLITINEYRERYFSDQSRPARKTIRRWIANGTLAAEKRGRAYYIDTDRIKRQTGNPIADRVLNHQTG